MNEVKTALTDRKELGTNCWVAERLIDGVRCGRVYRCSYPERNTCKAVDAEISALKNERRRHFNEQTRKIRELSKGRCPT